MKIRLHQFLSKCGVFTSKKEIKEAIWNGEILINDSIVKDIKFEFNPNCSVALFHGEPEIHDCLDHKIVKEHWK